MLRTRNFLLLQRRWKSTKQRWSVQQKKKTNMDRALESFDDFYGSVYGARWRAMRASLLTEHKYVALVNNFGDTEKTCSQLELDGAINVKSLIQLAKERLEEEEPATTQPASFKMSDRLDEVIKKQTDREIMSLYPEQHPHIPEQLQYKPEEESGSDSDSDKNEEATAERVAKAKKSLEQSLEEDSLIDTTRLVDPQFGTGALYDFVPATQIKGREDWVPESEHYKYYPTTTDFPLKIEMETEFAFPENLCLYTYEMGNCAEFKPPRKCLTGVLSHYLMDGASVLPPLLLDVRHGERVLDACAAPGGKALLLLQTLHPKLLVCNDVQESRVNRLRKVFEEYLFDYRERWEGERLLLMQEDARNIAHYDAYDKILVDVPCTTDRHALNVADNNIFKPTRIKERLRLPELQAGILANCLRLLRPGGSLVYSTCSLSPVQNDGVVHMALQQVFNEHGITATIKDLSLIVRCFGDIYRFEPARHLKYGQMVVPYLPANFGPMYFCKITRDG